ncbi:hypothetical protein [Futiania mangrovi]|uniref:Uncharacterized protein n=1 Tax=Futiania mangrovi TaxID=2959716 RepID=A0A9J6PBP7_9PROT|nr:hypothetical protein [Futiania mangrovii]MCP1337572.1 hypothetical protein [Futiania mangrovii]
MATAELRSDIISAMRNDGAVDAQEFADIVRGNFGDDISDAAIDQAFAEMSGSDLSTPLTIRGAAEQAVTYNGETSNAGGSDAGQAVQGALSDAMEDDGQLTFAEFKAIYATHGDGTMSDADLRAAYKSGSSFSADAMAGALADVGVTGAGGGAGSTGSSGANGSGATGGGTSANGSGATGGGTSANGSGATGGGTSANGSGATGGTSGGTTGGGTTGGDATGGATGGGTTGGTTGGGTSTGSNGFVSAGTDALGQDIDRFANDPGGIRHIHFQDVVADELQRQGYNGNLPLSHGPLFNIIKQEYSTIGDEQNGPAVRAAAERAIAGILAYTPPT